MIWIIRLVSLILEASKIVIMIVLIGTIIVYIVTKQQRGQRTDVGTKAGTVPRAQPGPWVEQVTDRPPNRREAGQSPFPIQTGQEEPPQRLERPGRQRAEAGLQYPWKKGEG